jgi:hypothetical protein
MTLRLALGALSLGALLTACDPLAALTEVRVGEGEIPPVDGSSEIAGLDTLNFTCGDALSDENGLYDITSAPVAGGCQLNIIGEFEVIGADDYDNIPDLSGNSIELVKRVELIVSVLSFSDLDSGAQLSIDATFTSLDVLIEGQAVLDEVQIAALPATITLPDSATTDIKNAMQAAPPQAVSLGTEIVAVVSDAALQTLPARLGIDFVAQPEFVLGVAPLIQ